MVTIEVLGPHRAELGEGPCWDPARQVLWWVDVPAGELRAFDPASGIERSVRSFDDTLSHVALRADGGLRLAVGLELLDVRTPDAVPTRVLELPEPPGNRCNDGACDPAGRYWIGTMDRDAQPGRGALYRLDDDGPVQVLRGVSISNGIGWDRAGERMYYVDSPTRSLEVFDVDLATGAIEHRRTHAVVSDTDDAVPDGLTLDAEDGIWVAVHGGGVLHRYDARGELTELLELPVTYPTSCVFGGERGETLYCTSASADADASEHVAGALLALDVGVRGLPPAVISVPGDPA